MSGSCRTRSADRAVPEGEADQRRLFELARLYVMPNLAVAGDAKGFGISIIEAGAYGIAAVAARVDGIPDAVIEGRSGILVPPGDAPAFVAAICGAALSPDEVRRGPYRSASIGRCCRSVIVNELFGSGSPSRPY